LFGKIINGLMHLNGPGHMVGKWWQELERKFPLVRVDAHYTVMPNHFHGIIFMRKEGQDSEPHLQNDVSLLKGAHAGAPLQKIVQWFKTMTTNNYIHGVKESGWRPFKGRLWQRSFYEHVIRNDESLNHIREYILTNPQSWHQDRENPRAKGRDEFDEWLAAFKTRPSSTCRGAPACAPSTLRELGAAGEDLAAAALKKQGYKILERNWRSPLGEVDLIARHGQFLVLVEVKTRRTLNFGGPREAVTPAKQARLRRLAEYYIREKRLKEMPVRFDIVGISIVLDKQEIEIIQDAF
jgi:putative transposase